MPAGDQAGNHVRRLGGCHHPFGPTAPAFQPAVIGDCRLQRARYGRANGAADALSIEQMWYGLRPAYVAQSIDNPAIHAGLQSGIATGQSTTLTVGTGAGSLNDNVPANTGVPTWQFGISSSVGGGGGHAFWEWGTRGDPTLEATRFRRALTGVLTVAGFHAADGTIVAPSTPPIGRRTREVVR